MATIVKEKEKNKIIHFRNKELNVRRHQTRGCPFTKQGFTGNIF